MEFEKELEQIEKELELVINPIKKPDVIYTELRNKQIDINKFFYGVEDTYEDIKQKFKCSDEIIAKAIEYDLKKDDKILNELKDMIKIEQEQNKRDFELLNYIEKILPN
jgi:hypothetical protein